MSYKRLIVIDISNFIFRAFYAIRPLTAPDGTPVNAVYGVLSMMHKMIETYEPTHILVAQDTKEPSFRKEKYPDYKANRTAPPDDLIPQFDLIAKLVRELGFYTLAYPGYEADDIIGTIVKKAEKKFDEILIASGDKDLMQFVTENVKMLDTMKEVTYGPQEVFDKMGVRPDQIVDYLSLIGDSSDNIPGVPGIGPKGASKLLADYGTLDECLKRADEVKNAKTQNALKEHKELAKISQDLAQIVTNLELPCSLDDLAFQFNPSVSLKTFLEGMGFKSYIAKLKFKEIIEETKRPEMSQRPRVIEKCQNLNDLAKFVSADKAELFLYPIWRDELNQFSPLDWLSLHQAGRSTAIQLGQTFSEAEVLRLLSETKRKLVTYDLKNFYQRFKTLGLESPEGFDLSQAHFVIDPEDRHDFERLVGEYTGRTLASLTDGQMDLLDQSINENSLIERAELIGEMYPIMVFKLKERDLGRPYYDIDLPLLNVLAGMEVEGIKLDVKFYASLSEEFSKELREIEEHVHKITNADTNLRSPKQVGELLFEKLQLPVIRKTKTGYSTDADVLGELIALDLSPVPEQILRYRELDKLVSTYVKALPLMVSEKTGKLHTHFHPGNAATGRLSSEHPNLQNIPVRTVSGQRLREGFIPSPGNVLLSADYSQVELRILAHFANDTTMLQAFMDNKDIHQQTAAEIFEIPLNQVTKEQRNSAKAINFGLMYGQTSFGLSQALKISQGDAKKYITLYFSRFNRVKSYLDSLKDFCETNGYAETYFGRKRYLPDIKSTNRQIKSMAERVAINSPIQGTAADIIKIAMINIDTELRNRKLKSKMLLQVHDELIFDVPPNEVDEMMVLVRDKMENAVTLSLPLKVEMGTGVNWYKLK